MIIAMVVSVESQHASKPAFARRWWVGSLTDSSSLQRSFSRCCATTMKRALRTPVVIRYEDLLAGESVDLSAQIEAAFGADGLGLLTVSGVPGVAERRLALLPLARRFAALPEAVKQRYEHPASFFSFGWSHGKEKLQGRPDTHKGSYYNNPLHDRPTEDASLVERFPAFYHPNIWPEADLPELEPAFKAMGRLIVEVGTLLARHCDAFVRSRSPTYPAHRLETVVRDSTVAKGRLLHYFPQTELGGEQGEKQQAEGDGGPAAADASTWCGWHNDHGSLTGLTPAMYLDEAGREVGVDAAATGAGLFVLSRAGELVQVVGVPSDHLIFQIGETAEIHSGGVLQATPHAVKGGFLPQGVSRETFAVFMEPEWSEPMDAPPGAESERRLEEIDHFLPSSVPGLRTRWRAGMLFSEFTEKTLGSYY